MKRIALTLLVLLSATSLFAQSADPSAADKPNLPPQPQRMHKRHAFWDRLNLTDEQKEKLKQIRKDDRESLGSAWAQAKIARESLHAALLANPENTADIQAKATNWANALSTKSVQLAMHEAKVSQVLTPTQRVILDEAIKARLHRWHRREGGWENGHWQRPGERRNQTPRTPAPTPAPTVGTEAPTQ
jgi:Spy/CpxP family protein refolding chaperone